MAARFEVVDSRTVRGEDGREYDVIEAINALPWIRQLCPSMPHEYTVRREGSPLGPFDIVDAILRSGNPDTYRAYFRGYQRPNRYWEAPDGLRYWPTRFMLNRCEPDSVEPLRRIDAGAKPIKDWDGPRFAPDHSGIYEVDAKGRWWPTAAALAGGYLPCKSCQRRRGSLG